LIRFLLPLFSNLLLALEKKAVSASGALSVKAEDLKASVKEVLSQETHELHPEMENLMK